LLDERYVTLAHLVLGVSFMSSLVWFFAGICLSLGDYHYIIFVLLYYFSFVFGIQVIYFYIYIYVVEKQNILLNSLRIITSKSMNQHRTVWVNVCLKKRIIIIKTSLKIAASIN